MTNAHPTSLFTTRAGRVSDQVADLVIRAVVDDFYQAARQDPLLGPVFEQHVADWPAHLETMYAFWGTLLHGDRRYAGNPFEKHRAVPELSGDYFARWLDLFAVTLSRHCNPRDAATWEAMVRRMGFSMSSRLGFGERSDLLP